MSNTKDLARIVADRYDLSLVESENFIIEMFELVRTTLNTEDTIKIKGLGTFKVQTVRERASVNVNTGEKVIIDSHDRITFTPDNAIRDAVNRPFAHFTTVPLNDGVEFDDPDKEEAQEEKEYQNPQSMLSEESVSVSYPVYDPEVELAKLPDAIPETPSVAHQIEMPVATENILQMEKPDDEKLLLKRVSEKTEYASDAVSEDTPAFMNNSFPEEPIPATTSSEPLTLLPHQKEATDDVVDIRETIKAVEVREPSETGEVIELGKTEEIKETNVSDSLLTEEKKKEEIKEESLDRDDDHERNVAERNDSERNDAERNDAEGNDTEGDAEGNDAEGGDAEGGMSTLMTTLLLLFVLVVGIVIGRVTSEISFDDVKEMVLGSGEEKERVEGEDEKENDVAGELKHPSSSKEKANAYNSEKSEKSEESEKTSAPSEERVLLEDTPPTKPSAGSVSPSTTGVEKKEQSSKPTEKKIEEKAQPSSSVGEWPMDKYDSDMRIRTGAYYITGVKEVVTVRSGQTLKSLSKYYLGEGMECYIEALNGVKEVKVGQKIKIPSLKLKKKKK